jgi:hypothetical protein
MASTCLHRAVGGQQLRLPRAGGAAHDVDRRGEGYVRGQDGDTGLDGVILGIPDAKARDIGDEVAWPWLDHDATIRGTVPR